MEKAGGAATVGPSLDELGSSGWALASWTVTALTRLVVGVEPAAWSTPNLRAMNNRRGRKDNTKVVYLQMIEFATGLDASWTARGPLRKWGNLLTYTKKKCDVRQCRGREYAIPHEVRDRWGL